MVGALSTALHYAMLVVAVEGLGAAPMLASGVGFLAGALLNYALNRCLTFASQRPHRQGLPRFIVMVGVGSALNVSLLGVLLWAGVHYLPGQVVATVVVMGVNFSVLRYWVFPASGR